MSATYELAPCSWGSDHGHVVGDLPPVLWESMVFGGKHNEEQRRYDNLADAKAGHIDLVALVRESDQT